MWSMVLPSVMACITLVWHEVHVTMESAIMRKKEFKKWKRQWKLSQIETMNPDWRDLYRDLI
jgi:putative endonuclease